MANELIDDLLPKNHLSLTTSAEILSIAEPLFKVTGLNYFYYARTFGRNLCCLHTDVPMFLSWFKNKFRNRNALLSRSMDDGVYLWEDTQNKEHLLEARALNHGNGISIIRHHQTHAEAFVFAAPVHQPHIMTLYLNQMELLNKFFLYFKDRASKLIEKAVQQPIVLPDYMIKVQQSATDNLKYENYKHSLKIQKYNINEQYHDIKLSKRELQCLGLYLKRKTTTQIAFELNLQKSSVDKYIFRIKQKFKCKSSTELVELFWELGILKSNGWFEI